MEQHEETSGTPPEVKAGRPNGDGIEQLREILIGAWFHDLERRIARTDAQHAARETDLKYEARRRVEIVESHVRKELDLLSTRVERESGDTAETMRSLVRDHRENMNSLEERVAKLEGSISHEQRVLRQEILEQAKAFLDELENLKNELSNTLERRLGNVESELQIGAPSDESKT